MTLSYPRMRPAKRDRSGRLRGVGNVATSTATFHLEAGETVKCTFTNVQRGEVYYFGVSDVTNINYANSLGNATAWTVTNGSSPQRSLGSVSVIGPLRMDYGRAIRSVRDAAAQLSSFVTEVYDER